MFKMLELVGWGHSLGFKNFVEESDNILRPLVSQEIGMCCISRNLIVWFNVVYISYLWAFKSSHNVKNNWAFTKSNVYLTYVVKYYISSEVNIVWFKMSTVQPKMLDQRG